MNMSQREAARRWGVPRATLQRAIASGKLSLTSDKRVDVAEMVRVFGNPEPAQTGPNGPIEPPSDPPQLALTVARLEAENAALRELVKRADAERDRALETVQRLLIHEEQPKPWWFPFRIKSKT